MTSYGLRELIDEARREYNRKEGDRNRKRKARAKAKAGQTSAKIHRNQRIVRAHVLHVEGKSISEISGVMGHDRKTIKNYLSMNNPATPDAVIEKASVMKGKVLTFRRDLTSTGSKKYSKTIVFTARSLFIEGCTKNEIADQFLLTKSEVSHLLRRMESNTEFIDHTRFSIPAPM